MGSEKKVMELEARLNVYSRLAIYPIAIFVVVFLVLGRRKRKIKPWDKAQLN